MNILYLDCGMGAAGDMLSAALLELLPEEYVDKLNALGIPGVEYVREKSVKCGIQGTHLTVKVHGHEEGEAHDDHHHEHSTLHGIHHIVDHLSVSEQIKKNIMAVYDQIAEAESAVHGVPVSEVHFHEVGAMDAVADVTAFCYLLEALAIEKVIASPVHVGCGTVRCAHGVLPVPAPATAKILCGVPIYGGKIQGELCTPTGAALLRHFVTEFGDMPIMQIKNIGYGMGKKDFERANCVRALLGTVSEQGETVTEFSCNVDDMTGEEIAFCTRQLLSAGALDVFTTAIGMKKSRPGTMITVLCKNEDKEKILADLFRFSTTLGIREQTMPRYTLRRSVQSVETPFGTVHEKVSVGYGVTRKKIEYEDLAKIAQKENLSLEQVRKLLQDKE